MLGDSTVCRAAGSSADAAPPAAAVTVVATYESGGESSAAAAAPGAAAGGHGSNSGEDERGGRAQELGERSFGGNRWPRQETLALLKIRSEMDVAFRDASVKGPLWEEVSRKLAELGYSRSAKKCREKFENVYKYHKRTKEGRTGKSDGKAYRFFDQLKALETNPSMHSVSPSKTMTGTVPAVAMAMAMAPQQANITTSVAPYDVAHATVPSSTATPMTMNLPFSSYPSIQKSPTISTLPSSTANPTTLPTSLFQNSPTDLLSISTSSPSSSSSTSSDEEVQGRRNKRKRKWKDFFERLMKEVIGKQEDMQKRFLEAIEKRERDRMVREEAWRAQEMARIVREREILSQERSMAGAKDAAVMSFLQKIADQHNLGQAFGNVDFVAQTQPPPTSQPAIPVQQAAAPVSPRQMSASVPQQQVTASFVSNIELTNKTHNCEQNFLPASSSRWPKVEVQALIQLRTSLDTKYQDNGPKGPLWEEISAAMRKLGYSRNAKRCKEKWENINKYFKKVKESNKKRTEDSKTCPYFHLLDDIYKKKNKFNNSAAVAGTPESIMVGGAPLMVTSEQQWPPQQEILPGTGPTGAGPDVAMEDLEGEPAEEHHEDKEDEEEEDDDKLDGDDDDGDGDEEEDEDEGGSNFEIVPSKPSSSSARAAE